MIFSAARLLLSRIGGIKNGDRAAEKITQVGSILEEKTIAEGRQYFERKKITQVGSILKENDTNG